MTVPALPDSTDECGGGSGGGGGSVTSVGLTEPVEFVVTGSPVVGSGTLVVTKAVENPNTVWAGPAAALDPPAQPTFRALTIDDIPPGVGTGSVTSVGLAAPVEFTVSGSPVTGAGTLTFDKAVEDANKVWAGPVTGPAAAPTFRVLDIADIPPGVGTGSVTSVAQTVPAEFTISGSPITGAGTLAIGKATETANTVWAGPTTGAAAQPTFRALVDDDLPPGTGTATSVGLAAPVEFTVSGSPVTTSGTLTFAKATEVKNTVWAGPTSGADAQPTFRALTAADLPPGPIINNVTNITNNYNLGPTDVTILANTTSNSITITLPASPDEGRTINCKKIAAANSLIMDGNGKNIDGAATLTTTAIYDNTQLTYDSTFGWAIL